MNPKLLQYIESKGYSLVRTLQEEQHLTLLLEDPWEEKIILKTHLSEEGKIYIQNEIDFYAYLTIPERLHIKLPELIKVDILDNSLVILLEFIEGITYADLLTANRFNIDQLNRLAIFTDYIENIHFIPTVRSLEKRKNSFTAWNKLFHENSEKWYRETSSFLSKNDTEQNPHLNSKFLDSQYQNTLKFNSEEVGLGGMHGSQKLQEYIEKGKDLYVLDWENASSVYIKYYMTASVISYMTIRLDKEDLANEFLKLRHELLKPDQVKVFDSNIQKLISQRNLGNIWDLMQGEVN